MNAIFLILSAPPNIFKVMNKKMDEILKKELAKRKKSNKAYSLRSFARSMGISPAALSQMMSGKRGMSLKRFNHLIEKLKLPMNEIKSIVRDKIEKRIVNLKGETIYIISEWYHFAILCLLDFPDCKSDPKWFAEKLNIKVSDVKDSLRLLEKLKFIENKDGKFKVCSSPVNATSETPSEELKAYHKKILEIAKEKLDLVKREDRSYSTTTIAIDKSKLADAIKLIEEFEEEMTLLLENGNPDEVYQLSVQLFPLSI